MTNSSLTLLAVGLLTHDLLYIAHTKIPAGIVTAPHYLVTGDVADLVYCVIAGHKYQDAYQTASYAASIAAKKELAESYGDWRHIWKPILDRWHLKKGNSIAPKLGVWTPE